MLDDGGVQFVGQQDDMDQRARHLGAQLGQSLEQDRCFGLGELAAWLVAEAGKEEREGSTDHRPAGSASRIKLRPAWQIKSALCRRTR